MFRQLHRWTSLPLILFLILVLSSGVYLQFEEIGKASSGGRGPPPGAEAAGAQVVPDDAIAAQLADALTTARAEAPDLNPTRIELQIAEGQQRTRLATRPRGGSSVEIDHGSGEVQVQTDDGSMSLHVLFIRLHTGSMFGAVGVWIMFVSSLILLFLAISGIYLYWQMWQNRRQRGRNEIFWK